MKYETRSESEYTIDLMKLNNLIYNLINSLGERIHGVVAGVCMVFLLLMASCAGEEPTGGITEAGRLAEGEETTVNLYLPEGAFQTRATVDLDNDEAKMWDLYFCAFPMTGTTPTENKEIIYLHELTPTQSGVYSVYPITLKKGDYHVYVLSNVNSYLTGNKVVSKGSSETDISGMILQFGGLVSNKGLSSSNLPMACLNTEIRTEEKGEALSDGVFSLTSPNQKIYADLTLLCAKVRYTILFDKGDFSEDFYTAKGVDYTNILASNVRKETALTTGGTTTYESPFELTLGRYEDSGNLWDAYLAMTDETTTPPASFTTTATWDTGETPEPKRIWQGVAYLPENTLSSRNQTKLTLTPADGSNIKTGPNESGVETGEFTLTLRRGNFYDIVAKLITPEVYNYDVKVYVKIKPWEYESIPTEW